MTGWELDRVGKRRRGKVRVGKRRGGGGSLDRGRIQNSLMLIFAFIMHDLK